MIKSIYLNNLPAAEVQQYLQQAIAPRPICFAATISSKGQVNLSPFSFFNLFSIDPPLVIFSPLRRLRDNSTKHTWENILEVPEVAINIVNYDMVQQVSLASCDYPKNEDEFLKAGFTKEPSLLIAPPRVRESPIQLECKVVETKPLGDRGGAGNLVIAEVLLLHLHDTVLDEQGKLDQRKLDLVGRLGGNWYTRVNNATMFEVEKPNAMIGIGIDALPESIRSSRILTGNNLGQLANLPGLPTIDPSFEDDTLKNIVQYYSIDPTEMENELHIYAKALLEAGKVKAAWQVLLALNEVG